MDDADKIVAAIFAATMCTAQKNLSQEALLNNYDAFCHILNYRVQAERDREAALAAAMKPLTG